MNRFKNLAAKLGMVVAVMVVVLSASAQTVTYFHNDMAGTPMVATDARGNVVWKESYQPYGERLYRQAAGANNQIWFAGKPQDVNTGLTYMGARYYDPVVGRFMGVDPLGFDPNNMHSFNRYAYANNNPVKFVDPDGRSPALIVNLALRALAWVGARQAGVVAVAEVTAGVATGAMVPGVAVEQGVAKVVTTTEKVVWSPAVDNATGSSIGRIIADQKGNAMIEPVGGRTIAAGKGGIDTHTLYPNGSNYQRLNPQGHTNDPTPHGHGHQQGTGPGMKGQGSSINPQGTPVPSNSKDAHWPIN